MKTLRASVYRAFFAPVSRGENVVTALVVFSILLAVAGSALSTDPSLPEGMHEWLHYIQLVLGWWFVVEYILRIWSIQENPEYRGAWGTLRYAIAPMSVIDLLAALPAILPLVSPQFMLLRALRMLRIFAILRLGRYSMAMQTLGAVVMRRRAELIAFLAVVLVVVLLAGTVMHHIEGDLQPEQFGTVPRSLWWGVITMTTIGYGDMVPVSGLGRVVGGILALVGIGLVALPAGLLASSFQEEYAGRRRRRGNMGSSTTQEIDSVCPCCGQPLPRRPAQDDELRTHHDQP